ncbi:ABC transporter ATP-binding protein [Phragmitibacter flavus]|uniref:ABC transporter ATP-binding protein n=1 Tax=Phragmitibacter flavus TaxID=2576071 RepID=A0A5R8KCM5_9BACT|nr:ABC transporter ATP-binding protein [Phragmitibacter flavus]TLD70066.1 ABC transporter ATP-binding protein [Phragmitibacter flavus]
MLEINNLQVAYGSIKTLHGISLKVPAKSIVTLIGANGAGKSTTLRAISGLAKVRGGTVTYDGQNITNEPPHQIVSKGLCHVPEGRMVFANLTVKENLQMGAYLRRDKDGIAADLDYSFQVFPRLKERINQAAGTLSGGEQQMLAIARALMSKPRFLMLDEPSLGIAPILVRAIFDQIVAINKERGLTILLVEQNANLALAISHYGYVLETGKILLENESQKLREDPQVKEAYLGH